MNNLYFLNGGLSSKMKAKTKKKEENSKGKEEKPKKDFSDLFKLLNEINKIAQEKAEKEKGDKKTQSQNWLDRVMFMRLQQTQNSGQNLFAEQGIFNLEEGVAAEPLPQQKKEETAKVQDYTQQGKNDMQYIREDKKARQDDVTNIHEISGIRTDKDLMIHSTQTAMARKYDGEKDKEEDEKYKNAIGTIKPLEEGELFASGEQELTRLKDIKKYLNNR